jgi:hypothetical protein
VAQRKTYRVRRTIGSTTAEDGGLRKTLWGVPEAAARRVLHEQDQAHTAELAQLDAGIASTAAEIARLQAEVDYQKRRLKSLRSVVEVLRDKLATERAAKAVLQARLIERQADEKKEREAAMARMEAARLSADVTVEYEILRQLVAALYRSIAGRGPVPANLEVLATIPVEKPAGTGRTIRAAFAPKWHQFLIGKKATAALTTPEGHQIIAEWETIGPDNIAAAEEAGLLFELILGAKVIERIPDL